MSPVSRLSLLSLGQGVLVDPNFAATQSFVSDVQAAASSLGKEIEVLEAPTSRDIDTAFARLAQKPIDALLVGPSPLLDNRRVQLATLAAYYRVPAIYLLRGFAEAGGLMSYGTSITDAYGQVGIYTGRILKGDKTRRPTGLAINKIRVRDQPQHRQGIRP